MNILKLALHDAQSQFRPGQVLSGVAGWQFDVAPTDLEVRLFWRTQGKGTEDVEIVARFPFDHPQIEEARAFQFTLPNGPYSFSGELISLLWGLELVAKPSNDSTQLSLTLSPTGQEIQLRPR